MIPQARKKWLVRSQQHDGVVVEMVEKSQQGFAKQLWERGGRWERSAAARVRG